MYTELNKRVCIKLGMPVKFIPAFDNFGLIYQITAVEPNLCEPENLKKFIQIVNKHKKTHKISYNGDTKIFLEKIYKMRLTEETLKNIKKDFVNERWNY